MCTGVLIAKVLSQAHPSARTLALAEAALQQRSPLTPLWGCQAGIAPLQQLRPPRHAGCPGRASHGISTADCWQNTSPSHFPHYQLHHSSTTYTTGPVVRLSQTSHHQWTLRGQHGREHDGTLMAVTRLWCDVSWSSWHATRASRLSSRLMMSAVKVWSQSDAIWAAAGCASRGSG